MQKKQILDESTSMGLLFTQCQTMQELYGLIRVLLPDDLQDDQVLQLAGATIQSLNDSEGALQALSDDLLVSDNGTKTQIAILKIAVWSNLFEMALTRLSKLILQDNLDAAELNDLAKLSLYAGEKDAARELAEKALVLGDKLRDTRLILGELHMLESDHGNALSEFIQAYRTDDDDGNHTGYSDLVNPETVQLLSDIQFNNYSDLIESLYEEILNSDFELDYLKIYPAIEQLLSLKTSFKSIDPSGLWDSKQLKHTIGILSHERVLNKLMRLIPIPSLSYEKLLVLLRRNLLLSFEQVSDSVGLEVFLESLATQCFITDYIYPEEADEREVLHRLVIDLDNGRLSGSLANLVLLLVSCYRAPTSVPAVVSYIEQDFLDELPTDWKTKTFFEVLEENHTRSLFSSHEPDSEAVGVRYIAYPRLYNSAKMSGTLLDLYNTFGIKAPLSMGVRVLNPEILVIEGCGGSSSLEWSGITNAKLTSISEDVGNLCSLARRKNLKSESNIECNFDGMIMLEDALGKFDLVVCDDAGYLLSPDFQVATSVINSVKTGGLIKIKVKAKAPESCLAQIRNFTYESASSNNDQKRIGRQTAVHLFSEYGPILSEINELFVRGSAMDLLFAREKDLYSMIEINDWVQSSGLRFCGFVFPTKRKYESTIKHFYSVNGEGASILDLLAWQKLIEVQPNLMQAHLEFFVQKVG